MLEIAEQREIAINLYNEEEHGVDANAVRLYFRAEGYLAQNEVAESIVRRE